jgi:iron complex outermembrane receptor protein
MSRYAALATCLLSALPIPAVAQDDQAAQETIRTTPVQIIVTARRRAEDVETVPIAVSVVGRDLLDTSYTVNTQALSLLVPALN